MTKQVMLGKASMNPDFKELGAFIDQTFGVKTVNIVYDAVPQPRIGICFEFEHEARRFWDNDHRGYDAAKQSLIANRFKETVQGEKYQTNSVHVYYSAFEPVAKRETIQSIPKERIEALKGELNCEELWEIFRNLDSTTFFLYTDEQVRLFKNSGLRKVWTDKYFDLLKLYDEFGYYRRDAFKIDLDSKENFDNNYESNWFYYSRR